MTEQEAKLHEFILAVANRLADAAEVLANRAEKREKKPAGKEAEKVPLFSE